jgi:hypothetical protein
MSERRKKATTGGKKATTGGKKAKPDAGAGRADTTAARATRLLKRIAAKGLVAVARDKNLDAVDRSVLGLLASFEPVIEVAGVPLPRRALAEPAAPAATAVPGRKTYTIRGGAGGVTP